MKISNTLILTLALLVGTTLSAQHGGLRRRLGNGGLQDSDSERRLAKADSKRCFSINGNNCVKDVCGRDSYKTRKQCREAKNRPKCFSNTNGRCIEQKIPVPGAKCYATKRECNKNKPDDDECFVNQGGMCIKWSKKPGKYNGQQCYANKKQCNHAISHGNRDDDDQCFINKGGMCVRWAAKPGRYGGAQCYATFQQCNQASNTNGNTPSQTCLSCLRRPFLLGTGTFCWRDQQCYSALQFNFSPCRTSTRSCASRNRSRPGLVGCAADNVDCVRPAGMDTPTPTPSYSRPCYRQSTRRNVPSGTSVSCVSPSGATCTCNNGKWRASYARSLSSDTWYAPFRQS